MNSIDVQQLMYHCAIAGLLNPDTIKTSPLTLAEIINTTVTVVQQENIEVLLNITRDFMNLPSSDEATFLSIAISEQLMQLDLSWLVGSLICCCAMQT
jgi:hypothetical protein